MSDWEKVLLTEGIRLLGGLLLLIFTWSLGQRLLGKADFRKKRRELDMALSLEFELRFGEFKAIWRQWKAHYESLWSTKSVQQVDASDPVRWKLYVDATAAEGKLEAVFVKLATERRLSPADLTRLGLFRQAYQELREAIRDCEPMMYKNDHPRYSFFNVYGCHVAHIITREYDKTEPSAIEAERGFLAIQAIRKHDWKAAVLAFAEERNLTFPRPRTTSREGDGSSDAP